MIKRIGSWQKVGAIIQDLGKMAAESRTESLKKFGLKAEGLAKSHMSSQDLNWPALKSETLEQKKRKGQSENILIATSTYFQSISSWVSGDYVLVGVKKNAYSKDGKTVLADIAAVHEFGSPSRNIPERPLWRPTFKEVLEWHKKNNTPEQIFLKKLKMRV